ncbi:hypothetical protein MWMV2_MWMV2_01256 [Acinetobacter oleivorans]|uniref:Uncharacterized protein n=1 Tax=Acinetobacter beijerinckii CIP 110307 TaxID=1217648 RepID=N9FFS6_9GAMM|nr:MULTISPECIES: hypothetical protein [Acinetobacter]CAI3124684.1 hypothetical protein MWMV3_MWMV3_01256 [Acinetobacter oleivorans]ENW03724.1 hypothetical protein F933_03124 [Acinetobacter beijerinckii CIP 110307]OTS55794.1 hypothetical protein CAT00_03310 [Acinetobacter pittii]CAI3125331.1 hypothetical protein MWMV13_MWMV13_01256 [Acinetobacter oleivorans]CAI3125344.1 hypothetical protein MWMV5_MWMV5_01256 [Acinetobacter oleivorans]
MTLWMKVNFIVVISVVMITYSWAKPASTKAMHTLDDSELSKVTDHDHSDKNLLTHTHEPLTKTKEVPQNLTKENDLRNLKLIQTPQPK